MSKVACDFVEPWVVVVLADPDLQAALDIVEGIGTVAEALEVDFAADQR